MLLHNKNTLHYLFIAIIIAIPISTFITNVIFFCIIFFLLIETKDRDYIYLLKSKSFIASIIFVLYNAISFLFTEANIYETLAAAWGWRKILLLPIGIAIFHGVTNEKYNRYIRIITVIGTIYLIYSFLNYIFPNIFIRRSMDQSDGIVLVNYSFQGIFFAALLFIVLSNFKNNLFKYVISFLILINIYYITQGRAVYIATIVSIIIYVLINNESKTTKIIQIFFISCIIAAISISSTSTYERVKKLHNQINLIFSDSNYSPANKINITDEATDSRYDFYINTLKIINLNRSKIIFGHGAGKFSDIYNKSKSSGQLETGDPHNQYLKIIIENGLLGLLLFTVPIWAVIRNYKKNNCIFQILMLWLITSCFNSHFSTFVEGNLIWALMGFFYNLNNSKFDDSM